MCVCARACMHVCMLEPQQPKEDNRSQELELQKAVVSCPRWVLGIKPCALEEQWVLTTEPFFQPQERWFLSMFDRSEGEAGDVNGDEDGCRG